MKRRVERRGGMVLAKGSPGMWPHGEPRACGPTGHILGLGTGSWLACQGQQEGAGKGARTQEALQDHPRAVCGHDAGRVVDGQPGRTASETGVLHSKDWLRHKLGAQIHSKSKTVFWGAQGHRNLLVSAAFPADTSHHGEEGWD